MIDKSAIVHPSAEIHPSTHIGPGTYIGPNVRIGANCHIEGMASIGSQPEHRDFWQTKDANRFGTIIGDNVIIREFVTINHGTERPTIIHDGCYLLAKSHVGHDAILEKSVGLACLAIIGGFAHIMEGATLGLGAAVHQRQVIPPYCMIGMNAAVTAKAKLSPFEKWAGVPAKRIGINQKKLDGFDSDTYHTIMREHRERNQIKEAPCGY